MEWESFTTWSRPINKHWITWIGYKCSGAFIYGCPKERQNMLLHPHFVTPRSSLFNRIKLDSKKMHLYRVAFYHTRVSYVEILLSHRRLTNYGLAKRHLKTSLCVLPHSTDIGMHRPQMKRTLITSTSKVERGLFLPPRVSDACLKSR